MKKIKEFYDYQIWGRMYRFMMKLAHKYNWHHAPPIFPENDIQLWCKWCGNKILPDMMSARNAIDMLKNRIRGKVVPNPKPIKEI